MKKILLYLLISFLATHLVAAQTDFYKQLADSALTLTKQRVRYDPCYVTIPYPNGDVPGDYLPGDIVCWNLTDKITHIGIVVDRKSSDGKRYMMVHNIGGGQVLEDCLFSFKIIGHYRYDKAR